MKIVDTRPSWSWRLSNARATTPEALLTAGAPTPLPYFNGSRLPIITTLTAQIRMSQPHSDSLFPNGRPSHTYTHMNTHEHTYPQCTKGRIPLQTYTSTYHLLEHNIDAIIASCVRKRQLRRRLQTGPHHMVSTAATHGKHNTSHQAKRIQEYGSWTRVSGSGSRKRCEEIESSSQERCSPRAQCEFFCHLPIYFRKHPSTYRGHTRHGRPERIQYQESRCGG